MARDLITPCKTTDMDTASAETFTGTKISTANGAYIKTTGIDPTKLVFVVTRSSVSTGTGRITVVSGSTAGKDDYEKGAYSTARNLDISVTSSTGSSQNRRFFVIQETKRFLDTDQYIKFNFSTHWSTGSGSSYQSNLGAIYISEV